MNITLKNSFHGTSVTVRAPKGTTPEEAWFQIQAEAWGQGHPTKAALARLRRVTKALCGCSGCLCGTVR